MHLLSAILIGISLAIDCFAAAACFGFTQKVTKFHFFSVPLHFGIFQGLMVILGFLLGSSFASFVSTVDHWIAFTLLSMIGIKMIVDSKKKNFCDENNLSETKILLVSLATSIDALIIGIVFSFVQSTILVDAIIIALVSFCFGILGLLLGERANHMLIKPNVAQIFGGIVLISIGIKTLITHIF